ncbi:MAG: crossover junction endodeoxyribonuclease RuvC [Pseudomonadota bacterium]
MSIILGIDPGSRITGYGVVKRINNRYQFLSCGCIRVEKGDLSHKLHEIFSGLSGILKQYKPDEAAIEKVFMAKNADSALKLGQARGAAITAVAAHGLTVGEYSARQIKQAVVGTGAAEKHQIQHMVKLLLNLNRQPPVDAADALAVAICHGNFTSLKQTAKVARIK